MLIFIDGGNKPEIRRIDGNNKGQAHTSTYQCHRSLSRLAMDIYVINIEILTSHYEEVSVYRQRRDHHGYENIQVWEHYSLRACCK